MAKAMSSEYQKISDILNKELAAIEKQRAQQAREIEALKTQILQRSYDTKILSEKILDFRESGNRNYHNVLDLNDYVKGKEGIVTIMKQDKSGPTRTRPRSMKTESSADDGEDENEEDPYLDEGT
nr:uncharacterized protein LOC129260447 [Lytechinus pictus]